MSKRSTLGSTLLGIGLLATGQSSQALEYSGYFRGGPGLTSNSTSRACYGLNGGSKGMKYRLGNECDIYGEFQLAQGFKKDGLDYKATLMINHYTGATDTDGSGMKLEQMWAEARGFDIAPEATFWIGKERGRRADVHIVDTFFTEMSGVGVGAKGFTAGTGKLGVAYYKTESSAVLPGHRANLEWVGVDANPGGKFHFFGTLTHGQFSGGTDGVGLAVQHDQSNLFGSGLNNVLWVQYAQGSAGLNSNFGDLMAGSAAKSYRIIESISWQKGAVGGQAMLLYANEKDGRGVSTKSFSLGGRMSYAISRNFKLLVDGSSSQYKTEGAPVARLSKLTIAPTLSTGPDFWTRPEFRLYITTARWNRAAGNVTGQAAFANKTSGTSAGAQVEWWF